MNDLLDAQDEAIERARNRAADLAHGLRTPLTVLVSDAGKLRSRGEREIADELEDLARSMQRHVDHELARVRVAGEGLYGRVGADLAEAVRGVLATLRRTPRGEALEWELEVPDECPVAIDAHDLSEVVGNILENAAKWGRQTVRVEVARRDGAVTMQVADDGPGVPEARIDTLGMRGVRLDEQTPGTGMGLAIVREILAAYGAGVSFRNRAAGGLEVAVTMRAAGDA
ncbi:MAG TPA: HAMP domain-containing histidine kinase [Alphaproteobacteria bacterium]|nr:HAMP domain-containing histidine kinase [Alphaproteobacteria bacterium]